MRINSEQELREVARAMRVEADIVTDPVEALRLRILARDYERRSKERRGNMAVKADA